MLKPLSPLWLRLLPNVKVDFVIFILQFIVLSPSMQMGVGKAKRYLKHSPVRNCNYFIRELKNVDRFMDTVSKTVKGFPKE